MSKRIDETEFMTRARAFLEDKLGVATAEIAPDTDLVRSGILGSLSMISFLYFIECEREGELSGTPDLANGFSLRSAYELASL